MTEDKPPASPAWRRLAAAFLLAAVLAFSVYWLISLSRANGGFSSLWFLAVLPAFLSALICYIGDPRRTRGAGFYWMAPVVLVAIVCAASIVFLREGMVCLIMLAPIWLGAGWIGAFVVRRIRRRRRGIDPTVFNASLLLLPLLAGLIEDQIPVTPQDFTVTRRIVIGAQPDAVWPVAVANAHIAATEGRWTFAQNIAGIARPRATVMHGEGVGAIRTAYWGNRIHFDEVVTGWRPGRHLAWDFVFENPSLQDHTDRHISPDGPVLKIVSGEYRLEPLPGGRTRLTLRTRYTARTHVNLYAALWGEVFLGGIQDNVLTIIRDRAKGRTATPNSR